MGIGFAVALVAIVLGIVLLFKVRRDRYFYSNPRNYWSIKEFRELRNKGFDLNSPTASFKYGEIVLERHLVNLPISIELNGETISVALIGQNLNGAIIELRKDSALIASANTTIKFGNCCYFLLDYQGKKFEIPYKGDILLDGRLIGRIVRRAAIGRLPVAFESSVHAELRSIIDALSGITHIPRRINV